METNLEQGALDLLPLLKRVELQDQLACEELRDACWQRLHEGPWFDVPSIFRHLFALAVFKLVERISPADWNTDLLRDLDRAIMISDRTDPELYVRLHELADRIHDHLRRGECPSRIVAERFVTPPPSATPPIITASEVDLPPLSIEQLEKLKIQLRSRHRVATVASCNLVQFDELVESAKQPAIITVC